MGGGLDTANAITVMQPQTLIRSGGGSIKEEFNGSIVVVLYENELDYDGCDGCYLGCGKGVIPLIDITSVTQERNALGEQGVKIELGGGEVIEMSPISTDDFNRIVGQIGRTETPTGGFDIPID